MRRTRRLFTRPFVVTALGGGVAVAAGCPAPTSVNTRPAESRRPEHGAADADPGAARDVAPSSLAETLPFAENTIEPPERQPGELPPACARTTSRTIASVLGSAPASTVIRMPASTTSSTSGCFAAGAGGVRITRASCTLGTVLALAVAVAISRFSLDAHQRSVLAA